MKIEHSSHLIPCHSYGTAYPVVHAVNVSLLPQRYGGGGVELTQKTQSFPDPLSTGYLIDVQFNTLIEMQLTGSDVGTLLWRRRHSC
jgi:hypothetical protein